jgi:hypothetical protein
VPPRRAERAGKAARRSPGVGWRDRLSEIISSFSVRASIGAHWRTGLAAISPYETLFRRPRTRAMTTATGIKRRVARQKLLRWMFPERRSAHTKHRMRLRSGTHSTISVTHHSPTVSGRFSNDEAASGRVAARKSKRPYRSSMEQSSGRSPIASSVFCLIVIRDGSEPVFHESHVLSGRRRNDEQRMCEAGPLRQPRQQIISTKFFPVLPNEVPMLPKAS